MTVSLDGQPDDGEAGERDNVGSDVEAVWGSRGPDTLTGDDAPNSLFGGPGADTLQGAGGDDTLDGGPGNDAVDGGAGQDRLSGGEDDDTITGGAGRDSVFGDFTDCTVGGGCPAGNDRIEVVDGEQDQVQCGPGADVVDADARDVTATDPINNCESVARPSTQALSRLTVRRTSLRRALRHGLSISLRCAASCHATIVLGVSRATRRANRLPAPTIGRATVSRRSAGTLARRVAFTRTARIHLRRARRLALTVHVSAGAARLAKAVTLR